MRLSIVALMLSMTAYSAGADDLLQCVDPDVAVAFLTFRSEPDRRVTDEMPEFFVSPRLPESFDFIGSSQSERGTSVAYRTRLAADDALGRIERAYLASGWQVAPDSRAENQGGFQTARTSGTAFLTFCDEDGRATSAAAWQNDTATYLRLWSNPSARDHACSPDTQHDIGPYVGFAEELMPQLALPDDASTRSSGGGGVIRSSGDDADTHVRLRTRLDRSALARHFELQLSAQGWVLDTSWAGEQSLGSIWTLARDGLPRTSGTLQTYSHGPDDFTVSFSMLAL